MKNVDKRDRFTFSCQQNPVTWPTFYIFILIVDFYGGHAIKSARPKPAIVGLAHAANYVEGAIDHRHAMVCPFSDQASGQHRPLKSARQLEALVLEGTARKKSAWYGVSVPFEK